VTQTFNVEAAHRPLKWTPLRPIYAKIKSTSKNTERWPMVQPSSLGQYPTPWGNINVRSGRLFNTLGTILHITPQGVQYGTTTPYAGDVAKGQTVKRLDVEYMRRTGSRSMRIKYRKDLKKAVKIPARPFDFIAQYELDAIAQAIGDYVVASPEQKTILIPPVSQRILAPGGRRIPIL
jgi:hypothetical protein